MSLSKLLITGTVAASALTLLAAEPVSACMQFTLGKKDIALIGIIGTITMPLWIVPALGYGAVAGVQAAGEAIGEKIDEVKDKRGALAQKNGEWWRRRTQQLQPLLEETEKNPTPQTLMRIGMCFYENSDLMNARGYLRRATELAEEELKKNAADAVSTAAVLSIKAFCLFTLGVIKQRMSLFYEAAEHFGEARGIVEKLSANTASPKTRSEQEVVDAKVWERSSSMMHSSSSSDAKSKDNNNSNKKNPAEQTGSIVLDIFSCCNNEGWALLHRTLYREEDPSNPWTDNTEYRALFEKQKKSEGESFGEWCDNNTAADLEKAVGLLTLALQNNPTDTDLVLRTAIARYYKATTRQNPLCFTGETKREPVLADPKELSSILDALASVGGVHFEPAASAAAAASAGDGKQKNHNMVTFIDDGPMVMKDELTRATALSYASQVLLLLRRYQECLEVQKMTQKISLANRQVVPISFDILFYCKEQGILRATVPDNIEDRVRPDDLVTTLARPWRLQREEFSCGETPHVFVQRKFHRPSWCDFCMQFISLSENDSAWQCEACKKRYHDECRKKIGSDQMCTALNCTVSAKRMDNHQHILRPRSLHHPTWCDFCTKYCWKPKGLRCEMCGITVHEDCGPIMRNALIAPETK